MLRLRNSGLCDRRCSSASSPYSLSPCSPAASFAAIPTRPQIVRHRLRHPRRPRSLNHGKMSATAQVYLHRPRRPEHRHLRPQQRPAGYQHHGRHRPQHHLRAQRLGLQVVRISPPAILAKGSSATWTFTYAGAPTVDTSPVESIKFAQIADPISILLYPGRWFPISMPGLFTDRFTAEVHITVPTGERVIGSGFTEPA